MGSLCLEVIVLGGPRSYNSLGAKRETSINLSSIFYSQEGQCNIVRKFPSKSSHQSVWCFTKGVLGSSQDEQSRPRKRSKMDKEDRIFPSYFKTPGNTKIA